MINTDKDQNSFKVNYEPMINTDKDQNSFISFT